MGKGKGSKGFWIIKLRNSNRFLFFKNLNCQRVLFLKKFIQFFYVDLWY